MDYTATLYGGLTMKPVDSGDSKEWNMNLVQLCSLNNVMFHECLLSIASCKNEIPKERLLGSGKRYIALLPLSDQCSTGNGVEACLGCPFCTKNGVKCLASRSFVLMSLRRVARGYLRCEAINTWCFLNDSKPSSNCPKSVEYTRGKPDSQSGEAWRNRFDRGRDVLYTKVSEGLGKLKGPR